MTNTDTDTDTGTGTGTGTGTDTGTGTGTGTYDPKIFEENSRNMDQTAKMNVLLYPVGGVLIGFGLGAGVVCCGLLKAAATLAGGAAGGFSGYRYGLVRGTELRSQAQVALCLAEIERNTRKTPGSGGKSLFGRFRDGLFQSREGG
jgi:hypothetical protein